MEDQKKTKTEIIRDLEETKNLINQSIGAIKNMADQVPRLHEANRAIDDQLKYLKPIPESEFLTFPQAVSKGFEIGRQNAGYIYEKVTQAPISAFGTSTSAAYSGATGIMNWMEVRKAEYLAYNYAQGITGMKDSLTRHESRSKKNEEITSILTRLLRNQDENTFESIQDDIGKVESGLKSISELALSMRTLLEKVKSELNSRLHKQVKGNKILPAVAEELLDSTKMTPPFIIYLGTISQYTQFAAKLTDIGKLNNKTPPSPTSLAVEFETIVYGLLIPISSKI